MFWGCQTNFDFTQNKFIYEFLFFQNSQFQFSVALKKILWFCEKMGLYIS